MKVSILSKIISTPSGGGNQFLKALRDELIIKGVYENDPYKANIILFNSFNFLDDGLFFELLNLKKAGKIIVHRVDGPISLYREKDLELDKIIYMANNYLADATIFQSKWSQENNKKLGIINKKYETIIINAPTNLIFYPKEINKLLENKIKIVSTSWSNNFNKGFDTYQWLDNNLDFDKYEMTFVGNTSINFKNIKHIPAVDSKKLGEILRDNDIFIFASKIEACSNSLLEALHTKLPCIVYNGSSNPEVLNSQGLLFSNNEEILSLLDRIVLNYKEYTCPYSNIKKIDKLAEEYIEFFKNLETNKQSIVTYKVYLFFIKYYIWRIKNKIKRLFK